ncbi:hypothetical protein FAI40_04500 [Acetobacteraceae bacterium]|nr:hypothetical protein FAI40_04500 [Acetobacteraceae bacterium]
MDALLGVTEVAMSKGKSHGSMASGAGFARHLSCLSFSIFSGSCLFFGAGAFLETACCAVVVAFSFHSPPSGVPAGALGWSGL